MILGRSCMRRGWNLLSSQRYLFSVRVRYAPSPTGFMHIGGLRTAFFNYLFAKNKGGQFIIRVEDTDKKRQVAGSLQNIFQSLTWLGTIADESIHHGGQYGPYIQSERLSTYKNIEKELLKSNKIYPCFCPYSPEKEGESEKYNGKCRGLSLQEIKQKMKNKEEHVFRIKSDLIEHPKYFEDGVFGKLQFKELDDFIIVKRNGWPTFHFANVVDDWLMKITHVIRGEEWLTNTNKHIYMYKILGAEPPSFIHLPLIKAMNGKKLAKRDAKYSVKALQDNEFEVDAVRNFLFGLSTHKSVQSGKQTEGVQNQQKQVEAKSDQKQSKVVKKELITLLSLNDMIESFDISKITRVPSKFDMKYLEFLNRLTLKTNWKNALGNKQRMQYFLSNLHKHLPVSEASSQQYKIKVISAIIDRLGFISELKNYDYFFKEPKFQDEISQKDFKKLFGTAARLSTKQLSAKEVELTITQCDKELMAKNKKIVHNLRMIFEHVIEPKNYNEIEIAKRISELLIQSPELKNEDVFHLLRFMVTGRKSGPNIAQGCAIIGQDIVAGRIARFSSL